MSDVKVGADGVLTADGVEYVQARRLERVDLDPGDAVRWIFEGSVAENQCDKCGRVDIGPAVVYSLAEAVERGWLVRLVHCECRATPSDRNLRAFGGEGLTRSVSYHTPDCPVLGRGPLGVSVGFNA